MFKCIYSTLSAILLFVFAPFLGHFRCQSHGCFNQQFRHRHFCDLIEPTLEILENITVSLTLLN